MRPFGRCFLPGPTDVHPEVWDATLEPMFHYSKLEGRKFNKPSLN